VQPIAGSNQFPVFPLPALRLSRQSVLALLLLVANPLSRFDVLNPCAQLLGRGLEIEVVALAHEVENIAALSTATETVVAAVAVNVETCLGFA